MKMTLSILCLFVTGIGATRGVSVLLNDVTTM